MTPAELTPEDLLHLCAEAHAARRVLDDWSKRFGGFPSARPKHEDLLAFQRAQTALLQATDRRIARVTRQGVTLWGAKAFELVRLMPLATAQHYRVGTVVHPCALYVAGHLAITAINDEARNGRRRDLLAVSA